MLCLHSLQSLKEEPNSIYDAQPMIMGRSDRAQKEIHGAEARPEMHLFFRFVIQPFLQAFR
jgi:hypothetical protein